MAGRARARGRQVTSAGAEVLPFLASCGVLPASLGFFFYYGRLVEALPPAQVFYAAVAPLVAFYVAFAALLYPAAPVLHPTGLAAALGPRLPAGFAGLLKARPRTLQSRTGRRAPPLIPPERASEVRRGPRHPCDAVPVDWRGLPPRACAAAGAGRCSHAASHASRASPEYGCRGAAQRARAARQMVEYWTYALFFCVAELWGPIVISLLFWTLANEVCTVQDARTIYPLMGIAANIALVVAGGFIKHVTAAVPQARAAPALPAALAAVRQRPPATSLCPGSTATVSVSLIACLTPAKPRTLAGRVRQGAQRVPRLQAGTSLPELQGNQVGQRRPPAVRLCGGRARAHWAARAGGRGAARADGRGAAAHGRHGGHQDVHGPARGGRRAHRAAQAAARQQAARQVPGPCADLFDPAQAGWHRGRSGRGHVPALLVAPCQVGPHLLSPTVSTLLWARRCCLLPCLCSRQRRTALRQPSPADALLAGPGKAGSTSCGLRSASASRGGAGPGARH